MSDIIARAKELSGNAHTPGPWFFTVEDFGNVFEVLGQGKGNSFPIICDTENPADSQLIAAVPSFAEAIAQETYEYTAQVFMNQHWVFMWTSITGNSVNGKWKTTKKEAQEFADRWVLDHPIRIVRRRVSPVEVVE